MSTLTIEVTNQKALRLMEELEALNIIKVIKRETKEKTNLADKYKGILNKEQGESLNQHIEQMRSEWNDI